MRFTPLRPVRLVESLSSWLADKQDRRPDPAGGLAVGVDGPAEVGAESLADDVAEHLARSGRTVIRASTRFWWRPASLRLEFGHDDVDMLLNGWVDDRALVRELIDPVLRASSYITRLRDPATDRSVRQQRIVAPPGALLLVDGPFLLAADLPLSSLVHLEVSPAAMSRALGVEKSWWAEGFDRYRQEYGPAEHCDVLIAYDHATAPAVAGL